MEPVPNASSDVLELPIEVISWLEAAVAGRLSRRERSVSRREGWLVDVDCVEGRSLEGFLRLERFVNGERKEPICQVRRETAVIAALHACGLPVPRVLAQDDALEATLFERVPGQDGIHELADEARQRAIAMDFMEQLARIHQLSPSKLEALGLDSSEFSLPVSAEDYALAGIDELESLYAASVAVPDPLALLTFTWLRRNVPPPPARPALVQGDTGPGNFVFSGDRVSAILDWECAHFGDPAEDLGHLYSRAFFHPWGDMRELIGAYAAGTNALPDATKLHFYRVASFAKAALGSTVAVNHFEVEGPLPMMIFFSVAGERGLAQSLVEAIDRGMSGGVPGGLGGAIGGGRNAEAEAVFEREAECVALPEPERGLPRALSLPLEEASHQIVDHELLPQLQTPFLRNRAIQLRQLASYQARRERYLSAVVARELSELRVLTSRPVESIEAGLVQLNAMIDAWDEGKIPEIARYLSRRAQRAEALALPLAGRYSNLELPRI